MTQDEGTEDFYDELRRRVSELIDSSCELADGRVSNSRELERHLERVNLLWGRAREGIKRLPMEKTPASESLYQQYAACQRAAGRGDGEQPLVGGGSDANTVAAVGLAVIDGLGPARWRLSYAGRVRRAR